MLLPDNPVMGEEEQEKKGGGGVGVVDKQGLAFVWLWFAASG